MKEYITLDAHKRYSFAAREEIEGGKIRHRRIDHEPGCIVRFLAGVEAGTQVAVEATGNWYWIVDEIEAAGCAPALVHPRKAKVMLGCINKTDKLDADGMNRLQRVGTLPTVWIAPGHIRDLRELPRTRMFLTSVRTALKNRVLANLNKYGLAACAYSDPFGKAALVEMRRKIALLPPQTAATTFELLDELEGLTKRIGIQEKRIAQLVLESPEMILLRTIPGIGMILAVVIALEIGVIGRFPSGPSCLLRGYDTAGKIQRRQDPVWPLAPRCEPLPEMGFHGGSQLRVHPAQETPALSCQPTLRTDC